MLQIGRRTALLGAASLVPFARARGQSAPPASAVTPELIAAANREGTVVFHTSIELSVCERIISAFHKAYPGVRVQLERTGAERILQRITQEYGSRIYAADVVESSDMGTFVHWKRQGILAPYVPQDVPRWPANERDPDGYFASFRASMSVIAYNTRQVKPEDAPRGFADLLHPRWRMRMVKAHPSYSGSILTSTYATVQAMGWEYMEKLAKQRVMQVQSAAEPPKKVAVGERPVQADGSEYVVLNMQEEGQPIAPVYAIEGTPILSGQACVMQRAAHPNAARLFQSFLFSAECQQLSVDAGNLRSFHPDVREKPGHQRLADMKLLRTDPLELEQAAEATKKRYAEVFGV